MKRKYASDFSFISHSFDDIKDFQMEPTGYYVLIRIQDKHIECALVDKNHIIQIAFKGKRAQDVYQGIFQYEKESGKELITEKQHIAYIGKELARAESALLNNEKYTQE